MCVVLTQSSQYDIRGCQCYTPELQVPCFLPKPFQTSLGWKTKGGADSDVVSSSCCDEKQNDELLDLR
jgi:hypothetical protein